MLEVMKILATSSKRSHAYTATLSAPNPAAGPHRPTPSQETPPHSQASLDQSLVGSLLLSPGSCAHKVLYVSSKIYFLVLCQFWQLYDRFNGELLQEGLCHTQVCCTQSLCPCGSPLLTCTFTRDAQTQFYLSLWGPWVLVCTRFF